MSSNRYEISPPKGSESVWPLYITVSEYDSTWRSIQHAHKNAELFYCIAGEGLFQVEDQQLHVKEDDLVIINPHIPHTERSLPDKHLSYIVLGVQGVAFRSPEGLQVSHRAMNYKRNRQELLPYFNDLVREAAKKEQNHEEACQHILKVLLIKLKRHEQFDAEYITDEGFISSDCAAAKRLMDAHYAEALDLEMLARTAHMSKFYFSHTFQKEYGLSPISYLTRRRIKEACQLLAHSDHLLSDISHMVGFSSPSYFSQVFSRQMGLSPRAYRKKARQHTE